MALSVFAAAREAPDRPALVTDHATLTYAQLAGRARRALAWLRHRDLPEGRPVAVVARNDLPTFELLHALIASGTPALLLHPRLTAAERDALVKGAGASPVLDGYAGTGGRDRGEAEKREVAGAVREDPPGDEGTLAIVPTSGTSGVPRGVVLSRRAFAAAAAASAANLGWLDEDRWLLPLPLAHVGGLSILTRCLLARRAVVLASDPSPGPLLAQMRRHRATLASLVPTVLARILDAGGGPAPPPPDHLRAVLLGGAAASPALLSRAADAGWPVLTTYGLTEACSQATTQAYGTVNRGELGSGRPLPGVELRIGDDDTIQLRGPSLFSGYLPPGDDPFLPGGWFPTGDRGRLDAAGHLHVLGRRTDRIVTGGENVDPVEVERALETLPGVRQACVFGRPDEEWGELVCAAVVLHPGGHREVTAAIRALRDTLAPFKVPKRVAVLDALPLNATGKVDRRKAARRSEGRLREI